MLIDNEKAYKKALDQLRLYPMWAVDVETNGLDPYGMNQLCGIGIGVLSLETEEIETFYFPVRHQQGVNLSPDLVKDLMKVMSDRETLLGYNLKFDARFLENGGLDITGINLIDGMILVRLTADSTVKELGLTKTIIRFYGEKAAQYDIDTKKYLRSNKWSKDFSETPPEVLGAYCEQDVYWTYRLYIDCLRKVKQSGQSEILQLEYALTKVLYAMENRGVLIDSSYAQQAKKRVLQRQEEVAKAIYELAGREFNIQSTQEIGAVFRELGIHSTLHTPKGKESWGEGALIQINQPIAGFIRQHRALGKLASTYLEPYIDKSVLHTSFCNWGTLTGRLSSRNPNLQNIPRTHFKLKDTQLTEEERSVVRERIEAVIASKGGASSTDLSDDVLDTWGFVGDESYAEDDYEQVSVRRLFIPREGYTLVSFDYSQMEVRVFLSYLQNAEIKELLKHNDVDFHGETAKLAFGLDETHPEYKFYRQMAKSITFGIIYGIGSQKLSQQLRTTQGEAYQYKKKYLDSIEGSREFIKGVMAAVEQRGWIKNKYGRVYKIPSDTSYKGVNYLVQGTSADILNERLIEVHNYLQDKKSNVVLQVHDEIICEIHNSELPEISDHVTQLLEHNSLGIPLFVDKEICSPSWATKVNFTEWVTNGNKDDIVSYIDWGN